MNRFDFRNYTPPEPYLEDAMMDELTKVIDEVDAVTSLERQEAILNIVTDICRTDFDFKDFLEVTDYFKKMINLCKQMNYSQYKSEQYEDYVRQINDMLPKK